ncbi:MAG: ATP-grasp domain-containing protein [Chloroflexi bacterium]|nr:ATP-grasp domain-containing protein [Chloroflexota bacterium]
MRPTVAIVYNDPIPARYEAIGEEKAIFGVLDEVAAVAEALVELGYPYVRLPLTPPIQQTKARLKGHPADLFFNLFEGFDGRPETEARMAGILAKLGLAFTGCPEVALALALDKARLKERLKASGIATPEYQVLSPENVSFFHLNFPCIVKPASEDASHGLTENSVVNDPASLKDQVSRVSQFYGGTALVEEFLTGREFNTIIIGNREPEALAVSEITYSLPAYLPRILTFAAKWETSSLYYQATRPVCPAQIEDRLRREIMETAERAYRLVGCRGYARVDMRLDARDRVHVLEVNPNPDISPTAGAALQIKAAGLTFSQFVEKIIGFALEQDQS